MPELLVSQKKLTASVDSESSLEFDKKLSSNSKSPLMFVDTFLYFE